MRKKTEKRRQDSCDASRRWRQRNPDKVKAQKDSYYMRNRDRWKPDGVCAICKQPERAMSRQGTDRPRALSLDHDHLTGKARGYLCLNCNRGLGAFEDEPSRLRKAAEYIDLHRGGVSLLDKSQVPERFHPGRKVEIRGEDFYLPYDLQTAPVASYFEGHA